MDQVDPAFRHAWASDHKMTGLCFCSTEQSCLRQLNEAGFDQDRCITIVPLDQLGKAFGHRSLWPGTANKGDRFFP